MKINQIVVGMFLILAGTAQGQFLPKNAYRDMIPYGVMTESEKDRLILYDKQSMPQIFQNGGGYHWINSNISADRSEPFGNPNRETPWLTGGLDQSDNSASFVGLLLPFQNQRIDFDLNSINIDNDLVRKIEVYKFQSTFFNSLEYVPDKHWTVIGKYPVGTKVFEFLAVGESVDSWKGWTVFEVRVLEKIQDKGIFDVQNNWQPRWFRAIRNRKHLEYLSKYYDNDYYSKLITAPPSRKLMKINDNNHRKVVIDKSAIIEELPDMSQNMVSYLNSRVFQEVTDVAWSDNDYAAMGGIFPRNFQGGLFDSKTCLTCHATIGRDASHFDFARNWYGAIRGFDGIFSLQLGDTSCATTDASVVTPQLNRNLLKYQLLDY